MTDQLKLGIPLFGKMVVRSLHTRLLIDGLQRCSMQPIFYLPDDGSYQRMEGIDYLPYPLAAPAGYFNGYFLRDYRRFVTGTESNDSQFRRIFDAPAFYEQPARRWLLYGLLLDVARQWRSVAAWSVRLSQRMTNVEVHRRLLREQPVDRLVVSGVGAYGFDRVNPLVFAAQEIGVPVISTIANYDTVVKSGYRGYMPDRLAVWSALMADDAMRLLGIPASQIKVTGPVQFDRYFQPPPVAREEFLGRYGLDPSRPTLLYAGGNNALNVLHFSKVLLTHFGRQTSQSCNIVIRPHPDPRHVDSYAPILWALSRSGTQPDGLYISDPFGDTATYQVADQDLNELRCWLQFSDVLINHYSTVGLEAALCDLPTIYIGYDPCRYGFRYMNTVRSQERQTHNLRPMRLKASRVARNEDELIRHVEDYLNDPGLERAERRAYAELECGALDGRATERLAHLIRDGIGG